MRAAANVPNAVWLGLGGNQGDRLRELRRALLALVDEPCIDVRAVSRVYETEYVGDGRQDPYYNACVAIETVMAPRELLDWLKGYERRAGRRPDGHMAPRPIDVDILLYGGRRVAEEGLVIPHREIRHRAFVLEPLAEIAPDRIFPDSGETIAAACAKIRRKSGPWIRVCAGVELAPDGPHGNKEEWRAALAVHCR